METEFVLSLGEQQWTLPAGTDTITIGRASNADIRLQADDQISRIHARLTRDATTWTLHDESRNGTGLNGRRLTAPTPLSTGDRIHIGRSVLTFHKSTAPDRSPHTPPLTEPPATEPAAAPPPLVQPPLAAPLEAAPSDAAPAEYDAPAPAAPDAFSPNENRWQVDQAPSDREDHADAPHATPFTPGDHAPAEPNPLAPGDHAPPEPNPLAPGQQAPGEANPFPPREHAPAAGTLFAHAEQAPADASRFAPGQQAPGEANPFAPREHAPAAGSPFARAEQEPEDAGSFAPGQQAPGDGNPFAPGRADAPEAAYGADIAAGHGSAGGQAAHPVEGGQAARAGRDEAAGYDAAGNGGYAPGAGSAAHEPDAGAAEYKAHAAQVGGYEPRAEGDEYEARADAGAYEPRADAGGHEPRADAGGYEARGNAGGYEAAAGGFGAAGVVPGFEVGDVGARGGETWAAYPSADGPEPVRSPWEMSGQIDQSQPNWNESDSWPDPSRTAADRRLPGADRRTKANRRTNADRRTADRRATGNDSTAQADQRLEAGYDEDAVGTVRLSRVLIVAGGVILLGLVLNLIVTFLAAGPGGALRWLVPPGIALVVGMVLALLDAAAPKYRPGRFDVSILVAIAVVLAGVGVGGFAVSAGAEYVGGYLTGNESGEDRLIKPVAGTDSGLTITVENVTYTSHFTRVRVAITNRTKRAVKIPLDGTTFTAADRTALRADKSRSAWPSLVAVGGTEHGTITFKGHLADSTTAAVLTFKSGNSTFPVSGVTLSH